MSVEKLSFLFLYILLHIGNHVLKFLHSGCIFGKMQVITMATVNEQVIVICHEIAHILHQLSIYTVKHLYS